MNHESVFVYKIGLWDLSFVKSHKPILYTKTDSWFSIPNIINIGPDLLEIFENITEYYRGPFLAYSIS